MNLCSIKYLKTYVITIVKFINMGDIHCIGFASNGILYGHAAIIMLNNEQLKNKDIIEIFSKQIFLAFPTQKCGRRVKKMQK